MFNLLVNTQVYIQLYYVVAILFFFIYFFFILCRLQSIFYFSFVCVPKFFMNKNTIEIIQTNRVLKVVIANIIPSNVNRICQMCC